MSINTALNNGLSGLRINQRSIAVLSQNIANVNTEGYSRQQVAQSSQVIEGIGSGVRFDDVVRKVDRYLQRAVQDNNSTLSKANVVSDYASRVQVLLGEPGSNNSLDEYVSNFFTALQSLAETPERTSYRSNAVEATRVLSSQVSGLAASIQGLRFQADSDLKDAVTTINDLLKKLDNTNATITRARALGQTTADLLDQRDKSLSALSEYLDINVFFDPSGQASVYTANGVALVDNDRHQVTYNALIPEGATTTDQTLGAFQVLTLNSAGQQIGNPANLITSGTRSTVSTLLTGGKLRGLQEVRDNVLPQILDQLDQFASRVRDEVNRVHNQGTGFPAPQSLTGTRALNATTALNWSGNARIAILDRNGRAVPSGYTDEQYTGLRPLNLNLSKLNSGAGIGKPTTQTIIDEINNYFNAPQVKVKTGGLNNIQLATNTQQLPSGAPPQFNFDFDVENITNDPASLFVTGVTVLDDTGTNITNVSSPLPTVALDAVNTYTTTAGSNVVTVRTTGLPPNVGIGDSIFLSDPGTLPPTIDGIPSTELTGYLKVVGISGNDVQVQVVSNAAVGTVTAQAGVNLTSIYDTIAAGEKRRTTDKGTLTADLSLAPNSAYYDITVQVGVTDKDGVVSPSTITYRILNNQNETRNLRYNNTAVTGSALRVLPNSSQEYARAILVGENGQELQRINGKYVDQPGYLKIIASNPEYTIAIDSLDSSENGQLDSTPAVRGTNRGFSHYFELNNLFKSNLSTAQGDTVAGSAINLEIEDRIANNPNLIATGTISLSAQPVNPDAPRQYTYVRNSGDNSVAQALAGIANTRLAFDPAGGLPSNSSTVGSYVGELLGYVASQASAATSDATNAETLFNGFKTRLDSIRGVNLDEELANTIIYQNAYSASARVIRVASELYDEVLGLIQ